MTPTSSFSQTISRFHTNNFKIYIIQHCNVCSHYRWVQKYWHCSVCISFLVWTRNMGPYRASNWTKHTALIATLPWARRTHLKPMLLVAPSYSLYNMAFAEKGPWKMLRYLSRVWTWDIQCNNRVLNKYTNPLTIKPRGGYLISAYSKHQEIPIDGWLIIHVASCGLNESTLKYM